ncbi:hypothetical protein Scep_028339 [Stephania cephalantha]|uniref:Uncharacterized protein n=1 Tax=Stephania cephalantha TaxID=152367 RepID=A0AAP0ED02_9MAGN
MSGVEGRIAVARRFSMRLGDGIGFVSKSGGSDDADFEFLEDELDWLLENSCHDKVIGSREEEEEEEEEGGESSSVEESKAFWEAQQDLLQSKRSSSFETPSEHIYLDVLGKSSSSSKRSDVRRVVIELNFRAEFEMARASDEYKRLVDSLPRVFVGKPSKLVGVIKIMCSAAKKCMKKNKMHMGPWRKNKYMEAKWLGSYRRMTPSSSVSLFSKGFADQLEKPKASMLTIDLHCTAVEVL